MIATKGHPKTILKRVIKHKEHRRNNGFSAIGVSNWFLKQDG